MCFRIYNNQYKPMYINQYKTINMFSHVHSWPQEKDRIYSVNGLEGSPEDRRASESFGAKQ